jgi:hypothetical protein
MPRRRVTAWSGPVTLTPATRHTHPGNPSQTKRTLHSGCDGFADALSCGNVFCDGCDRFSITRHTRHEPAPLCFFRTRPAVTG